MKTDEDIAKMIKAYRATLNWQVSQIREEIAAKRVCSAEFREQIAARTEREMKAFDDRLRCECAERSIEYSDALLEEALIVHRQLNGARL